MKMLLTSAAPALFGPQKTSAQNSKHRALHVL